MERKPVPAIPATGEPSKGIGVPPFILILCVEKCRKESRKDHPDTSVFPKRDRRIEVVFRVLLFRSHYKWPDLTLRRAHVTQISTRLVENAENGSENDHESLNLAGIIEAHGVFAEYHGD
jgi:hypothetical protein